MKHFVIINEWASGCERGKGEIMDNYICINGKKTELTEEQLKQLGIKAPKESFFERAKRGEIYYCINSYGKVVTVSEDGDRYDDESFLNGNYCTNKSLMEQRALHETLNRLLWRYSMEHDGDKINLNNHHIFRFGIKREADGRWKPFTTNIKLFGIPVFVTEEVAENAIKEIVEPFVRTHPGFKF